MVFSNGVFFWFFAHTSAARERAWTRLMPRPMSFQFPNSWSFMGFVFRLWTFRRVITLTIGMNQSIHLLSFPFALWKGKHMGGSINRDTPKWLVYNGKFQSKMEDDWVHPHDVGNLHMCFHPPSPHVHTVFIKRGVVIAPVVTPPIGWPTNLSINFPHLLYFPHMKCLRPRFFQCFYRLLSAF